MIEIIVSLFVIFIAALAINAFLTHLYMSKSCKFFHEKVDSISDIIVDKLYKYYKQPQKK